MISKEELIEIGKLMGFKVYQSEKDYIQALILFILSQAEGGRMVFKGGTCIQKFYSLNRHSEDLDFSINIKNEKTDEKTDGQDALDIDALINYDLDKFLDDLMKKITNGLRNFGIESSVKEISTRGFSRSYKFVVKGPLYTGKSLSLCHIKFEISIREYIHIDPINMHYISRFRDIPDFNLLCMDLREIMAEKVRAIYTRNYARDIYDLAYIMRKSAAIFNDDFGNYKSHYNKLGKYNLENDINPFIALINEKLKPYHLSYEKSSFINAMKKKKRIWKKELGYLLSGQVPEFEDMLSIIESNIL